jgi:peptidyl-dipeptidase Dcp
MNHKLLNILVLIALTNGCAHAPNKVDSEKMSPLLSPTWKTPYGVPPFEEISDEQFTPAFDEAMKRHRAEIADIASSSVAASFPNTIEALERAGATLDRVSSVFFNLSGTDSNDAREKIKAAYAPKLSKHSDSIYLDSSLWRRVKALFDGKDNLSLSPEQGQLLAKYHRGFIRAGANLKETEKKRLMEINAELASHLAKFGENIRKENEHYALVLEKEGDLAGLPSEVIAAAAATAQAKGMEGKWAFTLVRSSVTPFLEYAENRTLRKEIYQAYTSRGAHGDERDTRELILKTVRLRAERAALLGFESHAHYNIARNVAKTPSAVFELLNQLWAGALSIAKDERTALTEVLQKDLGATEKLKPWDWRYYAEKVRKARFDLSQDELKPYFQVDAVRQGAFDVASKLFGIQFEEVTNKVPRYHPEVKAFDVKDGDGSHIGLLYVDYHPRKGKRGGAWMNAFREQSEMDGNIRPVIVNVGNFPAPAGDKPALLGWDEVQTLFHEFGHALHGLLSKVKYKGLSGTNVKWDYVEFPSQLLENWASAPQVIKAYAKHYETGVSIPDELVAKIEKASKFNQGFGMTELVGAALLDMAWHSKKVAEIDLIKNVEAFEQEAIKSIGFIDEIAPRYHSSYFQHIFASDAYSAGYYVYLWAQVLEADAFSAFENSGDIFNPELAKRLRRYVFSAGASEDEMKLYESFRGQAASVAPLLKRLGIKSAN